MTAETPAKPKKTKVHDAKALRGAMKFSAREWERARWAKLIEDADRAAGTWSGHVVDEIVARAEQIRGQIPELLSEDELQKALGADWGQWRRAGEHRLLPARDASPYWTPAAVAGLLADPAAFLASIPAQPLGARKCADLLAELTGLAVHADDLPRLADDEHVRVARRFVADTDDGGVVEHDLYDVDHLRRLPEDAAAMAALGELVRVRGEWIAASLGPEQAAERLEWTVKEFRRVVAERETPAGWGGRYALAELDALAEDQELVDAVRRARTLGPDQAAQHLEIRRTDLEYLIAAGWLASVDHADVQVGRYKYVSVPLYSVGDLEDVQQIPGVDWEELRGIAPGKPSPLREWTRLPVDRATVVRAWCQQLHDQHAVEVWAHWVNAEDVWEIDWEINEDGHPTLAEAEASLAGHAAAKYTREIRLSTEVGRVIRWAREMLRPGRAAVLAMHTTGLHGVVLELGAIDPATGEVLLDTLVHPAGVATEAEALHIHGLTKRMLKTAPRWDAVQPDYLAAVAGRTVCSYNAEFAARAIENTHVRAGHDPDELPDAWRCLMDARSVWLRVGRWWPLGAGHARAVPRAEMAAEILRTLATAPPSR